MGSDGEKLIIDSEYESNSAFMYFNDSRHQDFLCDVKIVSSSGTHHPAHRIVLAARSDYFQQMFSSNVYVENKTGIVTVEETDNVLDQMLNYIYTGSITVSGENAQGLLQASDKYQLHDLFASLDDYISKNIDVQNSVLLLRIASKVGAKKIEEKSLSFVEQNFETVSSEHLDECHISKLSRSKIIHPEIFVAQLERWFSVNKSVSGVCSALENLDFTKLCKNTLLKTQVFYSEFPDCVRVLFTKTLEFSSSCSTEPLRMKLGAFTCTTVEFGKTSGIRISNSDNMDECCQFTIEMEENHVSLVQTSGKRLKCLIWLRRPFSGSQNRYRLHDFSSGQNCIVTMEKLPVLSVYVYPVSNLERFHLLQRTASCIGWIPSLGDIDSGSDFCIGSDSIWFSVLINRTENHISLEFPLVPKVMNVAITVAKEKYSFEDITQIIECSLSSEKQTIVSFDIEHGASRTLHFYELT